MEGLGFDQKRFLAAYERFYGERYDPAGGEAAHAKARCMCYLLKAAGAEIGDHDFSWDAAANERESADVRV